MFSPRSKENTRRVWNAASPSLLGAEGKSFSQEIRLICVKCWNLGSWHHPPENIQGKLLCEILELLFPITARGLWKPPQVWQNSHPRASVPQERGVLGKDFIYPATNLADGKKGDFGTVWHIAASRGGTVMDLLGTQLENLVAQDKAMTLWWDRMWQEWHRSCFQTWGWILKEPPWLCRSGLIRGVRECGNLGSKSSRKKTQPQPWVMAFGLLEMWVKNQHDSSPKHDKKLVGKSLLVTD